MRRRVGPPLGGSAGLRVLVASGAPHERHREQALLARVPDVEVVATAGSGADALASIARLTPDVAFLDLQMPGAAALHVLRTAARTAARAAAPVIVCTSSSAREAVSAFEMGAVDYLVRPVDGAGLARALARARHAVAARRAHAPAGARADAPPTPRPPTGVAPVTDVVSEHHDP